MADHWVTAAVTSSQKNGWKLAARQLGISRSELVRRATDHIAGEVLAGRGELGRSGQKRALHLTGL